MPSAACRTTAPNPINNDTRVPYRMVESKSLPWASVPSGKAGSGAIQADRWQLGVHDIDLGQVVGVGRRQQRRKDGRQHHGQQHDKAGNRHLVALEAVPEEGLAKAIPA